MTKKVQQNVGIEGNIFNESDIGRRVFSKSTLTEYKIVRRKSALTYDVVRTHPEGTVSVTGAVTITSK